MRLRLLAPLLLIIITTTFAAVPSSTFFVENEGQWAEEFRFRAGLGQGAAFVTERGLVLDLQRRAEGGGMRDESVHFPSVSVPPVHGGVRGGGSVQGHVLRLTFQNANPCPDLLGQDKLSSYSNYFLGRDSSRWKSRVGHYPRILAEDVWPGIHVEYVLKPEGVELIYHLQAGADPAAIQLQIEGLTSPLSLDADGNLMLATSLGPLTEHAPTAFQAGRAIPCRYRLTSDSTYTFTLDGYDPQQALTIDPLLYSTFFGGESDDGMMCMALDANRGVFVSGYTTSTEFPTTPGAYDSLYASQFDVFLGCFASDTTRLVYSTYLGAGGSDVPRSLCLLTDGSVCVGGETDNNRFPLTVGAFDTTFGGSSEGFLARISVAGDELLFSSYIGGNGIDFVRQIARDTAGRIYFAGSTESSDFWTSDDALFPTFQGGDPFVAVFDPQESALVYSTFFGSGSIFLDALTVVAPMRVWIGGTMNSGAIPLTADAIQTVPASVFTAFFSFLDLAAGQVVYSSNFGGTESNSISAILPLSNERVLLSGVTQSADFPVTPGAFDTAHTARKAFASVIGLPATLVASTLLGSRSTDSWTSALKALQDSRTGNIVLVGHTTSSDFPCTVDAVDSVLTGEPSDAFVACFSASLDSLRYGTLLGGNGSEYVAGAALTDTGTVWVTGITESGNFPITENAFQGTYRNWGDGFLTCLALPTLPDTSTVTPPHNLPPSSFNLSAFPNPFNSNTTLRFTLPAPSEVTLMLYDLLGREVLRKDLGRLSGGEHRRQLSGDGLSSGVYFARLTGAGGAVMRKVLLVK